MKGSVNVTPRYMYLLPSMASKVCPCSVYVDWYLCLLPLLTLMTVHFVGLEAHLPCCFPLFKCSEILQSLALFTTQQSRLSSANSLQSDDLRDSGMSLMYAKNRRAQALFPGELQKGHLTDLSVIHQIYLPVCDGGLHTRFGNLIQVLKEG